MASTACGYTLLDARHFIRLLNEVLLRFAYGPFNDCVGLLVGDHQSVVARLSLLLMIHFEPARIKSSENRI